VIALADDPEALIRAWRIDPDEAFDFSDGADRIEVKSFSGQARVHSFALRQARPGTWLNVVVASIRAERSSGGSSITDIMLDLTQRYLSTPAMAKMETVVAKSLGSASATGLTIGFDLERAHQSLLFFDTASIPCIDPVLPSGVVGVRIESLLDENAALQTSNLRARGSLFRSAATTDGTVR
jgi:hypothetical protein